MPPQVQSETWSHNTLSHPGRKIEFSSIFRQHFPVNIRTVQLRSTPAKIITAAYYFLRHHEVFELLSMRRSGLHPWTKDFVWTVPWGLSLSQPHVIGCCTFAACNTQPIMPDRLLTGMHWPALAQAESHTESKMICTHVWGNYSATTGQAVLKPRRLHVFLFQ